MKLHLFSAVMVFAASGAMAQHAHSSSLPTETGQAQFAAIAQIVTMLRNDPKTDWALVDIRALRDHLVDMDNVTTKAVVGRTVDGMNVTFSITGDEMVATSIQRTVLAHSAMLPSTSDWIVDAKKQDGGATMTLRLTSLAEVDQVLGLGFFGLMTIGAHHQQHHLMIASGKSPH
jgi:hypothetical protein